MPTHLPFPPLCREPTCPRTAGRAGYCVDHLAVALSRRNLIELVGVLEDVLVESLHATPAPDETTPLLN